MLLLELGSQYVAYSRSSQTKGESEMSNRVRAVSAMAVMSFLVACGGSSDTTTPVTVGPVTTVTVTGPATTVVIGGTLQLSASPVDAHGNAVTGQTATWASSDQTVATVNASGL